MFTAVVTRYGLLIPRHSHGKCKKVPSTCMTDELDLTKMLLQVRGGGISHLRQTCKINISQVRNMENASNI
jgi:hypothetical protein